MSRLNEQTVIGKKINEHRLLLKETLDTYGARYDMTGAAISRYENYKSLPSFSNWMKMAGDMKLEVGEAIIIYSKDKLPRRFQKYIERSDKVASKDFNNKEIIYGTRADLDKKEEVIITCSKGKRLIEFAIFLENKITKESANKLADEFTRFQNLKEKTNSPNLIDSVEAIYNINVNNIESSNSINEDNEEEKGSNTNDQEHLG